MSDLKTPKSWVTTELSNVAKVSGGKRIPKGLNYSDKPTPHAYLRVTDLKLYCVDESDLKYIDSKVFDHIKNYTINSADIYVTVAGSIGVCGKIPPHLSGANLTENADKLSNFQNVFDQDFLIYFLNSPFMQRQIAEVTRGAAQPKLSIDSIKQFQLPIPPTGEQKRIVAKIESTQEKIKTIEESVSKAEELIDKYRESLLQKAFRGQLVPQDPNDEPASELLKRIRAERAQTTDSKKKKNEDVPTLSEEEIPFEIPKSWEWIQISEVIDVRDGTHDSPKQVFSGIPLVTSKNLKSGQIDFTTCSYISQSDHEEISKRSLVEKGDLLMAMIGTIGNPVVVEDIRVFSIKNVALFKKSENLPDLHFLQMYLESSFFKKIVLEKQKGTTQKFMGLGALRSFLFPLPPTDEQGRILKAYQNAKSIVALLEDAIQACKANLDSASASILNNAFSGSLVPQKISEGTGHELLEKNKLPQTTDESKFIKKIPIAKPNSTKSVKKKVQK